MSSDLQPGFLDSKNKWYQDKLSEILRSFVLLLQTFIQKRRWIIKAWNVYDFWMKSSLILMLYVCY